MQGEIEDFRGRDNTEQVENMRKKNEELDASGEFYTEDPFAATAEPEEKAEVLGILTIPKIDEELTVYDRTDSLSLREGVGLLDGTHQPTGGDGNTTVLTGHDGMADASIFRHLDKLEDGDQFTFDNGSEVLTYEVYDATVVLPHETDKVQQIPDQDTMILLTCETPDYTKGINTHRRIVYAKRVPTKEGKSVEKPVVRNNTRYNIFGALGVLTLIYLIGKIIRGRNSEKE